MDNRTRATGLDVADGTPPGLVMTEMTCTSPGARMTPGCPGIRTAEQGTAWARVVDLVDAHSTAKIGIQIGHAGRKGSTKVTGEGTDDPLDDGNGEILAPVTDPVPLATAVEAARS